MLDCSTKSIRRSLFIAIRRSSGKIKGSVQLTSAERANKAEAYRQAHRWGLYVEDRGDMLIVRNHRGTGMVGETKVWLDGSAKQID